MPASAQQVLPFGSVHNVGLFSSHWLEHRLELEPEWWELRGVLRSGGSEHSADDFGSCIIEFD